MFLALSALQAADSRWRYLSSGRWELYTDAGESAGTAILRQLLEMQALFEHVALKLPASAPPIRVVLYRDAQDFKSFRQAPNTRGRFQSGQERDYILLLQPGEDTARAARHEYVHLVLCHTGGIRPAWLEEGLAEFFSTLRQRSGKAVVGDFIRSHQQLLSGGNWLMPEQFMTLRTDSALLSDAAKARMFYAQSWALTHLLMQAPDAAARMGKFGELLGTGMEQSAAFQQAFGRTMDAALRELAAAVAANRFPSVEVALANNLEAAEISPRVVSEAAARVVRAEVLMAGGKREEAAQMIQESARRWPSDPAVVASLGYLAMSRADYPAARRYLENAIALGDRQASTYFELAMLTRDTGGSEAVVAAHLTRAVELNPSFAEAWYLLGTSRLRMGRPSDAVTCLWAAANILPRQSPFWEALARAYQASGKREAARQAAQQAVLNGATLEQVAMARGLLTELDKAPAPAPERHQAVVTPKAWEPPKGDSRVSGRLVRVDCGGDLLKFHIQPPAPGSGPALPRTILASDSPNKIMLSGKSGQKREFVCGPQADAPLVEATYNAASAPAPAVEAPPPPKPAPAKGRRPATPAPRKPVDPPVAGELITLEFK
jgi:tetratricopeptide (TPR) repeat protein